MPPKPEIALPFSSWASPVPSVGRALALCLLLAAPCLTVGCKESGGANQASESPNAAPVSEAWVGPQLGRAFSKTYVQRKGCNGHFDVVTRRYLGNPPGFEVEGWAWNSAARQPVSQVLFVDEKDAIVGGGHGGSDRPDVPQAVKDITSTKTGWYGDVINATGLVQAYAILDPGVACPIGSMKF